MLDSLLNSLAIDPLVLLLNGATFLILLVIMDRMFWQPMLKRLEMRKQHITRAYDDVEQTRREMERLRAEYEERIAAIEAEANSRIQQTVRAAQAAREDMLAESRKTAESLTREGLAEIEAEHANVKAEMLETLNRVALQALARAQGAPADEQQQAFVREYLISGGERN